MAIIDFKRGIRLLLVIALGLPAIANAQDRPVTVEEPAAAGSSYGGNTQRHFRIERILGPFHKSEPQDKSVRRDPAPQRQEPPAGTDTATRLFYWNKIMLDANARDHAPGLPDQPFGEQLGPHRTSRAFAIVQIAVFDAVNAVRGGYQSYSGLEPAPPGVSVDAAIAQAAHDTLAALYPSQRAIFRAELAADLARLPDGDGKREGSHLGHRAAKAILALRENDGAQHAEPQVGIDYLPSDLPGKWRPDPISMSPLALGAYWGKVKPFVIKSAWQFDAPVVPPLDSPEYIEAFNEVKRLGGDGIVTPTERTQDQTVAGIFWSYDGTPGVGTPPRFFNQIAVQITRDLNLKDPLKIARLLALVNMGMADAAIAAWDTKYDSDFWRPITAIREADEDGNPATVSDPNFTPLGAQASNLSGPNFTPPFPAYTSGHATLGSTMFHTLRKFLGTDRIPFTIVSDEWNGVTRDNQGKVRPLIPRSFLSLSQAEEENGQSRIYLGIHWQFDKMRGMTQGRRIADYVLKNALLPAKGNPL